MIKRFTVAHGAEMSDILLLHATTLQLQVVNSNLDDKEDCTIDEKTLVSMFTDRGRFLAVSVYV